MKRICLLLFLVNLNFGLKGQSVFWGDLRPGSHYIGYKRIAISDSSRLYNGNPRPLLLSVWYPASANNNRRDRVLYKDYLFAEGSKTSLKPLSRLEKVDGIAEFVKKIESRGATSSDLYDLLELPTNAYRNSKHVNSTFHLVLALQGGGRPISTHFILNEYLASHGFIVASFHDLYASPNRSENTSVQNMEALGIDIELAISTIKSSSEISISKIGALGFSKAGEAILFHQVNEENLSAIITLDGQPGESLVEALDEKRLEGIDVPLMAFFSNHQNRLSYEQANVDSLAFEFLPNAPRIKIRMMELNHGDLTSSGMIASNVVRNFNRWPLIGDAKLGYETICKLVKGFYDLHLKEVSSDADVLESPYESLKVSKDFMIIHRVEAQ